MSLDRLDATTQAKLRSTQILTSLPQLVSELTQNSIDAGAKQIAVGVDCEGWSCWVKDDGHGISKDGLSVLETEGGRYGTSKAYTPHSLSQLTTFGFRGEALSSAADLCCLEISSRTAKSPETWSIIMKGGKKLYSGPAVRWRRESAGTVVSIREAFYNLPVRRKSHTSPARTIELIKQELEAYALVFPHIAFTLGNSHTSDPNTSISDFLLRIPATSSTLETFRHLYGKAITQHIHEVDEFNDGLHISGFISLNGAMSKSFQFLYVNRHPLAYGELQRLIDSKFAASTFAKHAIDPGEHPGLPHSNVRRSPRKAEKRPVYVLNLDLPRGRIDNCLEPDKSAVHFQDQDSVRSLLESVIDSFLVTHGFRLQEPRASNNQSSPTRAKRRRLDSEYEYAEDSGYAETFELLAIAHPLYIRTQGEMDRQSQKHIAWSDPRTRETFYLDPSTGNTTSGVQNTRNPAHRRTVPVFENAVNRSNSSVPHWLQTALKSNVVFQRTDSRVPAVERPSFSASLQDSDTALHHGCYNDQQRQKEQFRRFLSSSNLSSETTSLYQCFEKKDLQNVKVIKQVDRKFIACLMGHSGNLRNGNDENGVLVLVDQHAADERVRVERYLRMLCLGYLFNVTGGHVGCSLEKATLSPPTPVLLTNQEATRLSSSQAVQEAFQNWGITFINLPETKSDNRNTERSDFTQVFVATVPEVVHKKLLLADELRDLIKGYLAKLETEIPPPSQKTLTQEEAGELVWLKALRWCPQELLDLINSKACRGAIMFNDSLTIAQCSALIQQLSDTAFPFQCAHGRPSLVPLTSLGRLSSGAMQPSHLDWSSFGLVEDS